MQLGLIFTLYTTKKLKCLGLGHYELGDRLELLRHAGYGALRIWVIHSTAAMSTSDTGPSITWIDLKDYNLIRSSFQFSFSNK